VVRIALLTGVLILVLADLALAQAGSGSGSFGGGGGGGGSSGGGFSGGGGSGSGSGEFSPIGALIVFGLFGLVFLWILLESARYRIKIKRREARVHAASAEAAEDDPYFAASELEEAAGRLFIDAQVAWDARDRKRLAELVGDDLLIEWVRRLDDFDKKGWHNRVEVLGAPYIHYVGMTNREDDEEDRAVVRIKADLKAYVLDTSGAKIMRTGEADETIALTEYWTLARRDTRWIVTSIEQKAEGDHHLDEEIVASPWSGQRIADETLTELAVEDKLPEGFTTVDLAELDFDEDARARALDLSLADARFGPDVLEAAARRAVAAWTEAVDGEDAPLAQVASEQAIDQLLYAGDASRNTRLVVRGPRVKSIRIASVQVEREPATMVIALELGGRRYVENRDTAAVVSGDKDSASTFTEQWTLALDGPDDAPWRIVAA
jgi:predicted lipid-binding transport protein (Tim44 family)